VIITYSKQSVKALERIDTISKKRIKQAIENMPKGDIKKLKGHTKLYRLRVGDWRIVFSLPDNQTTLIEKIAARGDIYKEV
jgi:mRNA interferase RelE/StbE